MERKSIYHCRPEGRPHVALVTIDRPPVNAMSLGAHRELLSTLRSLSQDASVRCIVLTGAGKRAFIAGGEVGELGALNAASALERTSVVRDVLDAIRRNSVPVIGAINGPALGGGLAIAAQCDVIVAADTATFGLPEIDVGVMGGTKHLARIAPEKVMRWMALSGKRVSASYLERFGSIHQVVTSEALLETALEAADEICAKSPAAVRLMKEVINLTEHMNLNDGYHVETYATAIISTHSDSKEAARAFKEKRPGVYPQEKE